MVKQKVPGEIKVPRGQIPASLLKRSSHCQTAAGNTKLNCLQFHLKHLTKYSLSMGCSPFTIQDVLNAGLGDDGIVAFEPLVLVLADEGGVVAAL